MTLRLSQIPLFVQMVLISGLLMYVPAAVALVQNDHFVSRSFFYSGTMVLFVCTLIAIAVHGTRGRTRTVDNLKALFLALALLPAVLALPMYETLGVVPYVDVYFEMVSSLTTTGMTTYEPASMLTDAVHLWRGMVGWLGGLLMWVAAAAVLAPLSLGGFEVTAMGEPGQLDTGQTHMQRARPMKRWSRAAQALLPIYVGLTGALWIMLVVLGDRPIVGLMNAMATLSTSGITTGVGVQNSNSGVAGEMIIFLFLLFALSRSTFSSDTGAVRRNSLLEDPELRLGFLIVMVVAVMLFMRHWFGALSEEDVSDPLAGLKAAWGGIFTVMSFLTTTGFESSEWHVARDWSGLQTPGLILLALAMVGGGVATTAGGVKLLRVYALYVQGLGEMERLVHPNVVLGRKRAGARGLRRRGAVIAWVFFMLFALSLAAVTLLLALAGNSFEEALILAVSALTTAGPLTQVAGEFPIAISSLGPVEKLILCAAMIAGRLEALAVIALISPDLWQK
ncbi:TrkH family potassium uptake protein [Shimia sp. R9_1]|uniref:potassium transporter TrkG n=1 Tax=unclassified Shimia TaxID=2630038 RepID=UPI001ADB7FC5|nr:MULTISPECIES: potassium transporter TrkG [unclassified Shimia]MBO9401629.1 TrkH family potassium uptake protein [Shimia sp. R9_3]MBO9408155.1 TrkH family potassium uptake protein [Shimia sp. R9_1]